MAGRRFTPCNVVIAAIDDKSFAAHENQPLAFWGPNYANAISVLRKKGAEIIGIDMHFAVSAESWLKEIELSGSALSRTFDIPFREQLNSGKVILIGTYLPSKSGDPFIWPVNDYLFSLKGAWNDIGLSNLYTDDDEVIRSYVIKIVDDSRFHGMTFAPLLAKRAGNISFSTFTSKKATLFSSRMGFPSWERRCLTPSNFSISLPHLNPKRPMNTIPVSFPRTFTTKERHSLINSRV
jgi:CHASE2 domain-containing sensor protein